MQHTDISGAMGAEPVPFQKAGAGGRYSEQRQTSDFSAVLLFATPVDFLKRELVDDVVHEYPMLGVEEQAELNRELFAGQTWTTPLRSNAAGHRHVSRISSDIGAYDADFSYALRHSYGFENAGRAITGHTSWLRVSTPSEASDGAARVRAATATTCISALLTRLPGCLGVYLPGANLVVSPQRWARAADEAALGEFPIDAWIALAINRTEREETRSTLASCSSIGMAAFNGHEVHLPWSEMPPGEAARLVYSALWMLLVGGEGFVDGDTMGDIGDTERVRIRHAIEGKHGMQTDAWVLFDPSTVVREERLFDPVPELEGVADEKRAVSRLFGRRERA